MAITQDQRNEHARWLLEVTQIPTASGREGRVIDWIRRWAAARPDAALDADPSGNLVLALGPGRDQAPLFITAHLDHPAFVFRGFGQGGTLILEFRGGVMADYFVDARVVFKGRTNGGATLLGEASAHEHPGLKCYLARPDDPELRPPVGDVASWELPPAEIVDGILHTDACDDLAAVAAALAAFDVVRSRAAAGEPFPDVRLLFTRAEEIGFVGALAACRNGTMPGGSRVIALENSRAFDESPVGGGPIVRVGDRLSIFSPSLTGAIVKRAEDLGGAQITAQQKAGEGPRWKWQRKLMPGGACEATVFCAAGYEATCLCLPLGNYHNMADLARVQAGTNPAPARIGREYISVADFHGLVDLLVACAEQLPDATSHADLLTRLWDERAFVLEE